MNILYHSVLPSITEAMLQLGIPEGEGENLLGKATVSDHGDLAIACHSLSRTLKKSPVEIGDKLSSILAPLLDEIANISAVNGFVNLRAKDSWMEEKCREICNDKRLGISLSSSPRKVAIDYSSPNVAKEMHVGHLRSTVIGDSLTRILEFLGNTVIRENHIGDWGTPFGMLIEHLLDMGEDSSENELSVGDLDAFYKTARNKFDSDESFADRSRARVVLLQGGDEETIRLWQVLVDESTRYFNEVYQLLGVLLVDDDIMGESAYHHLLPDVVSRLSEQGLLKNSDGADVVFPGGHLNRDGEPLPLIVRKGDGGYNYATTDLACIIDRVERLKVDDLLYVVGTPQSRHFEMVFSVAYQAGLLNESNSTVHVNFGSVLGKDGKVLKSRSGSAVKLVDLLKESVSRANDVIGDKNPNLTGIERENIAKAIGIGAVKYADLSTDRTRDYMFDWTRMLSFEGDTAPYLQYAHARIKSIFERVDSDDWKSSPIQIMNEYESRLTRSIVSFSDAVESAATDLMPNRICIHLHEIASSFGSFYENCPVLNAEEIPIKNSRLLLCDTTARILFTGLELLGIDAPNRM
ncbi:MAG: arginine--tRNA ligase [Candidatus Thermoplasmatota archaeon]|nr:arginine--tRNA ligase [Candidatus Thermoplasmatota archaeon]